MILIDTHILIWDAIAPTKLSAKAIQAIDQANQQDALVIADITIWEIALLMDKGRLKIDTTISDFMRLYRQTRNISIQAITPQIAEISVNFDTSMNNDPADRLIAATAISQNLQLVTADKNLRAYRLLPTIW